MTEGAVSRYGERQLISAWVDQEQREQLVELARREDRSMSAVIRRALDDYLEQRDHDETEEAV